jgi:hypothetical protein
MNDTTSNPADEPIGRTIQIFLVDGTTSGLTIATMHGWTGSIVVARNQTLPKLLARPEAKRTGVYMLQGLDPENDLRSRVYLGEADAIVDRLPTSAGERGFWELAAIITTSDESLTKGHVRFLEAELIKAAFDAARVTLDNFQRPETDRRYLPEADRANMQAFLKNIAVILPVIGFDFLKPVPRTRTTAQIATAAKRTEISAFVIEQRSGVKARMLETNDSYIVQKGSLAIKDADHASNSYASLRQSLIDKGKLVAEDSFYRFTEDVEFNSPSAAAAVVLDRNSNGRVEWKLEGSRISYDEWQRTVGSIEATAFPSSHVRRESGEQA